MSEEFQAIDSGTGADCKDGIYFKCSTQETIMLGVISGTVSKKKFIDFFFLLNL